MDAFPNVVGPDIHRERLEQALRVTNGLLKGGRERNFTIAYYAQESESGIIGCIAGHCGLDPWFQERGFVTDLARSRVSIPVEDFFGTDAPFFRSNYRTTEPVTVHDAISALRVAIERLKN